MALKALVNGLVGNAFDILDDLKSIVTVVQRTGGVYDPITGASAEANTTIPDIRAALVKFKEDERDDEVITLTDMKCLIPADGLPINFLFTINDEIIDGATTWDVVRYLGVPGQSLHILHVRSTR